MKEQDATLDVESVTNGLYNVHTAIASNQHGQEVSSTETICSYLTKCDKMKL